VHVSDWLSSLLHTMFLVVLASLLIIDDNASVVWCLSCDICMFKTTQSVSAVPCCVHMQPPRSAHPVVNFSCVPCEPVVIENLPFDKYELEPSPLTQYILERRQPNVAWQVITSLHLSKSSSVCLVR